MRSPPAHEQRAMTADLTEDKWLIDPRRAKWMTYWDIIVMLALLFTAIVTPMEVSFMPPTGACVTPLFLINRFVDLVRV